MGTTQIVELMYSRWVCIFGKLVATFTRESFKGVVPVPDTKLSGGGCSHEVNQLDFSWFPTFQLPRSREESETVQTQPCYGALASKHCQIAWSESIFSSPIMKNRATIGWRTPLSKDQNWKQKNPQRFDENAFECRSEHQNRLSGCGDLWFFPSAYFPVFNKKIVLHLCAEHHFPKTKIENKKFPQRFGEFPFECRSDHQNRPSGCGDLWFFPRALFWAKKAQDIGYRYNPFKARYYYIF